MRGQQNGQIERPGEQILCWVVVGQGDVDSWQEQEFVAGQQCVR